MCPSTNCFHTSGFDQQTCQLDYYKLDQAQWKIEVGHRP